MSSSDDGTEPLGQRNRTRAPSRQDAGQDAGAVAVEAVAVSGEAGSIAPDQAAGVAARAAAGSTRPRRASRLDVFIARMRAQKALLEDVARRIEGVEGPVLELGLGNGRTFDHLREILPEREIFVFDRSVTAHPASIPDGEHIVIGEIRETLAFCAPRVGRRAALIHCDLGTGDPTADLAKAHWLAPLVAERTAPGGFVASGIALAMPGFDTLPRSADAELGGYWLYRLPV